ncbi:ATP-binding protein [Spirosoma sp. RP8]|uniref:histidine kinase n=1 Tax=Spirosoma liriopis TaxID=2937440 RepID=A0ABT0HJ11_9BACT|nr:ATP-binding protein [Spirosoma liriopis]MCK8491585.1 ATP-binding protein [Spirosoma liriopis]
MTVEYLTDTTDALTIGQLTNPKIRWQVAIDPALILGFTTHPVWCRFTLQQAVKTSEKYALELTNFYVDSLTLYQPDLANKWIVQHSGDMIPFAARLPKTRCPTIYVTVSGTAPQTFYARILSTQHHSYQWQAWSQSTFLTDRLPDMDRYIVFTLVFMLTLFLLALLLFMYPFVVLRSYALWGLAVCISVLFGSGYSGYLFPHSTYWAHTSNFVTVGFLLPALAYYVVQACHLPKILPSLVWLYKGFGGLGFLYSIISFFVRHAYITWTLIAAMAVMLGFTLALLVALYVRGVRPAIWNVLALLLLLPVYTYFYGRNAGFFTGSISEESLKFLMFLSSAAEPFFIVAMLWQSTRDRIRTANSLSLEQAHRENIQVLDKLKTDFSTNVSHELRTPIMLLLGPLQILYNRFPHNELYALMLRNAERLQTLTNQLLDLAKLDADQMQNSPTVGDFAADLSGWVALFDAQAQSQSVALTLHQNETSRLASYDADKVEKIVTNLLSNAIKFTPKGGSVVVKAFYSATSVLIDVRDTGVGIAPEVLPHVFDRFYQEANTNREKIGSGVGLALAYELVQLLEGSIEVHSQLGEGTTFVLSLPIQTVADQSIQHKDIFPTPSPKRSDFEQIDRMITDADLPSTADLFADESEPLTEKPLLLLVEDNDDLRTYIRMTLASQYTLLEAVDGQQGLEMALDSMPELIITDLKMPRLDGLDLCRALRADSRTDHIPLVMLTAKATVEDRLIGLQTGADDYLTKPFLPMELLLRLQNLLQRKSSQQAYWQRTFAGSTVPNLSDTTPLPDQEITELPDFLKNVYDLLEQHLDQSDFEVDQLADALAMSSRTLNRKMKGILGLTTREVIRTYRLRRGNELLEQGIQPTQAAYAVGFGSLSSFGRAYKEQYGFAPSTRKGLSKTT